MSNNDVVGELLTLLERREAALLEWGFYDFSHSADEIVELFVIVRRTPYLQGCLQIASI